MTLPRSTERRSHINDEIGRSIDNQKTYDVRYAYNLPKILAQGYFTEPIEQIKNQFAKDFGELLNTPTQHRTGTYSITCTGKNERYLQSAQKQQGTSCGNCNKIDQTYESDIELVQRSSKATKYVNTIGWTISSIIQDHSLAKHGRCLNRMLLRKSSAKEVDQNMNEETTTIMIHTSRKTPLRQSVALNDYSLEQVDSFVSLG